METIGERYYRLQQILLTFLGLWPYNDVYGHVTYKHIQRIFFIILLAFSILLQIGKIITSASNLENLLQVLSFAVPCLIITLKYATFCIQPECVKKLIELINYHLNLIKCKKELKILEQYYYIAKLMTLLLLALFYSSIVLFLTTQILPKFLDVVIPLNESRPVKLLGLAAFFFDQEKYFVLIFLHMTIALLIEATTIAATETMSMIYVQHICGLFKITRFLYSFNSYFETSYFLLLVLAVCSLSINLFRLFQAGFKKEVEELISIGIFVIIHFICIFLNSFFAQRVTNHSADIYYKVCELPWYSVPVPLQKVLQFIVQRSIKSCKITLYTVFVQSLEFFASTVSCSLSYFTIFWSVQHN